MQDLIDAPKRPAILSHKKKPLFSSAETSQQSIDHEQSECKLNQSLQYQNKYLNPSSDNKTSQRSNYQNNESQNNTFRNTHQYQQSISQHSLFNISNESQIQGEQQQQQQLYQRQQQQFMTHLQMQNKYLNTQQIINTLQRDEEKEELKRIVNRQKEENRRLIEQIGKYELSTKKSNLSNDSQQFDQQQLITLEEIIQQQNGQIQFLKLKLNSSLNDQSKQNYSENGEEKEEQMRMIQEKLKALQGTLMERENEILRKETTIKLKEREIAEREKILSHNQAKIQEFTHTFQEQMYIQSEMEQYTQLKHQIENSLLSQQKQQIELENKDKYLLEKEILLQMREQEILQKEILLEQRQKEKQNHQQQERQDIINHSQKQLQSSENFEINSYNSQFNERQKYLENCNKVPQNDKDLLEQDKLIIEQQKFLINQNPLQNLKNNNHTSTDPRTLKNNHLPLDESSIKQQLNKQELQFQQLLKQFEESQNEWKKKEALLKAKNHEHLLKIQDLELMLYENSSIPSSNQMLEKNEKQIIKSDILVTKNHNNCVDVLESKSHNNHNHTSNSESKSQKQIKSTTKTDKSDEAQKTIRNRTENLFSSVHNGKENRSYSSLQQRKIKNQHSSNKKHNSSLNAGQISVEASKEQETARVEVQDRAISEKQNNKSEQVFDIRGVKLYLPSSARKNSLSSLNQNQSSHQNSKAKIPQAINSDSKIKQNFIPKKKNSLFF